MGQFFLIIFELPFRLFLVLDNLIDLYSILNLISLISSFTLLTNIISDTISDIKSIFLGLFGDKYRSNRI